MRDAEELDRRGEAETPGGDSPEQGRPPGPAGGGTDRRSGRARRPPRASTAGRTRRRTGRPPPRPWRRGARRGTARPSSTGAGTAAGQAGDSGGRRPAGRGGRAAGALACRGRRRRRGAASRARRGGPAHRRNAGSGRSAGGGRSRGCRASRGTGPGLPGLPAGLTELKVADLDGLIETAAWAANGDGDNPAAGVIDDAARSAGIELGRQEAQLTARGTPRRDPRTSDREIAAWGRAATRLRRSRPRGNRRSGTTVPARRCGR